MSISESQSNSEPASDGLSGDVRLDVRSLCVGQVMEGALEVSEYTEVVDCYHNMSLQASG